MTFFNFATTPTIRYSQAPGITPDVRKLILCLIIDIVGTSSELIPFLGELTDIVYAPVAALALRSLFQGSNVVFALEFLEEFLPFTDILPLATIVSDCHWHCRCRLNFEYDMIICK